MSFLATILEILLHLDRHLAALVQRVDGWAYAVLALVVFCETGLVVAPFLPGDSLLFASGALAASGALKIVPLWLLLCVAAVAGDTVNYWIGRRGGEWVLRTFHGRLIRESHLQRAHRFYARHGSRMILFARFVPIVRTLAPFLAGMGAMAYRTFILYNIIGGVAWVSLFTWGGYLFGNIPAVKENFSVVILAIIILSVMPMIVEWAKARMEEEERRDKGERT